MEIIRKTARDGHTPITVALADHDRFSYVLVVTYGGRELSRMENSRPRKMATPLGELTHGLIVGADNKSVGLTAAEAATIDQAVDTWKAERLGPRPTDDEVRAAVAAMHCTQCGGRLSDFDLGAAPVAGVHFDCA